jgi:hypothetical protein
VAADGLDLDLDLPALAAPMISKQRRAWTAGSASTEPSGHVAAVPATKMRSSTARARQ